MFQSCFLSRTSRSFQYFHRHVLTQARDKTTFLEVLICFYLQFFVSFPSYWQLVSCSFNIKISFDKKKVKTLIKRHGWSNQLLLDNKRGKFFMLNGVLRKLNTLQPKQLFKINFSLSTWKVCWVDELALQKTCCILISWSNTRKKGKAKSIRNKIKIF